MKGEPIRILLVEDDPAHAEIVRRNLADFRVANSIVHVEDGRLALDYLFRTAPLQIRMPVPARTSSCSTCACPRSTGWRCWPSSRTTTSCASSPP